MRSKLGLAGSLILLLGVALAFASAIFLGAGGSEIIHFALGTGFLVLAVAVSDFSLPSWFNWIIRVAMVALASIFLLQCVADVTQSPAIASVAYWMPIQIAEKLLGYGFVVWCVAVLFDDSRGATRWLGMLAVSAVVAVDVYSYVTVAFGGSADSALKLLYLLLFVWLGAESAKRGTAKVSPAPVGTGAPEGRIVA